MPRAPGFGQRFSTLPPPRLGPAAQGPRTDEVCAAPRWMSAALREPARRAQPTLWFALDEVTPSRLCRLRSRGQLLLVRLRDPVSGVEALYPPGGAVEPNETPEEAARRETLEEPACTCASIPRSCSWTGIPSPGRAWTTASPPITSLRGRNRRRGDLPTVIDADYNLGAVCLHDERGPRGARRPSTIAAAVDACPPPLRGSRMDAPPEPRRSASMLLHDPRPVSTRGRASCEPRAAGRRSRAPSLHSRVLHHHHHAEEAMLVPIIGATHRRRAVTAGHRSRGAHESDRRRRSELHQGRDRYGSCACLVSTSIARSSSSCRSCCRSRHKKPGC